MGSTLTTPAPLVLAARRGTRLAHAHATERHFAGDDAVIVEAPDLGVGEPEHLESSTSSVWVPSSGAAAAGGPADRSGTAAATRA